MTKRVAKPTGRRQLNVAATVAAGLPLAISLIPALTSKKSQPQPATVAAAAHAVAPIFKAGCKLPFDTIKTKSLEIDAKCTLDGNAADNSAKRLENNAKNNFCADGTPKVITYDDFKTLEETADGIDGLRQGLKESRDGLVDILKTAAHPKLGEGSLVQFVAFVLDARNSNVGKGKGENVNCKLPDKEGNDIHIELTMDLADDDPCNGVTAEMSPHFRPETWNSLVGMDLKRPVRITGPLFFDDSHHPCHDGVRPNPKRVSVWEIHPIYEFEVCKDKTLKLCDAKKTSQWIPLDEWVSEQAEEPEP